MEKLLSVDQVVEITGLKKVTIYQMVHSKRIPVVKLSSRALRFRETDLEKWLNSRFQPESVQEKAGKQTSTKGRRRGGPRKIKINLIVDAARKEVGL